MLPPYPAQTGANVTDAGQPRTRSRRWLRLRPPIPHSGARAACDWAAHSVGPWLLHARAFRAGQREDIMTTTTFILLLNAVAQLLAAIAQLLAVLRRRRR
jgi:hypothetical protein